MGPFKTRKDLSIMAGVVLFGFWWIPPRYYTGGVSAIETYNWRYIAPAKNSKNARIPKQFKLKN